jgi:hypothetical protein
MRCWVTGLLCIVMMMVMLMLMLMVMVMLMLMLMVMIIIMLEMTMIAVRLMSLGNSISSQVLTVTIAWMPMQQRRAAALLCLKRRHRQYTKRRHRQYTACPAALWLMTKL